MKFWLLVLALAVAVGLAVAWQRSDVAYGRMREALKVAEARTDSLERVARRIDTVLVAQKVTLTRWRDSVRTLRDSFTVTDTVEVVRLIAAQDSTILACVAALQTCEQRVAAERAVTASVRSELALTRRLNRAPRMAAGVSFDAASGRFGVAMDRDVGRLRLGASVTPGTVGLRVQFWWP